MKAIFFLIAAPIATLLVWAVYLGLKTALAMTALSAIDQTVMAVGGVIVIILVGVSAVMWDDIG